jgi:NADH:ubiquinone reductase (H+-translocating)
MSDNKKKKVVILGGGYAGVAAGKELVKSTKVEVTLIDRHNFHLYFPSLYEVATEEVTRQTVLIPLRQVFGNKLNLIRDEVTSIDKVKKIVSLKSGDRHQYDYLVIALGATSNDFGISGVGEHSFTFRELNETLLLRDNIRTVFHIAKEKGKSSISLVICGGGFSGIELAAELRFHLEKMRHEYHCERVDLCILEASPQILPGMPAKVVDETIKKLKKLKIGLILGDPVGEVLHDGVRLKSGKWIQSDLTIWTAGTKSNPIPRGMGLALDEKYRPVVNEHLQVLNYPEIYAAGDLAGYTNPKTGRPIPPQAYQAEEMGKTVGENILRSIAKTNLLEFEQVDNNFVIPVGHNDSVALIYGHVITGIIPSIITHFIELNYLIKIFGISKAFPVFWSEIKVIAE